MVPIVQNDFREILNLKQRDTHTHEWLKIALFLLRGPADEYIFGDISN